MLSGHRRARPPLNLNATSVKEDTSFIIAKISWHFQYHKELQKFAAANSVSIACAPLLMHQANALPVNARSARQSTIRCFICLQPLTNNTNKEVVPNVTPPPSLLANYASESSNNEEAMLSTAVVLVCDSDSLAGRVKHGWIPDHKRTS